MGSPPEEVTGNSPVWMRQQRRKGPFSKLRYIAIAFLAVFFFMVITFGSPVCILLRTKYNLVTEERTANIKTLSSTNHGKTFSALPIHGIKLMDTPRPNIPGGSGTSFCKYATFRNTDRVLPFLLKTE
jgi:hypothetical protein